jgi:TonB family protein
MGKLSVSRRVLPILIFNFVALGFSTSAGASPQGTLEELQTRLKSQYAEIEKEIASPPSRMDFPDTYRIVLHAWQDRLANRFGEAAATVEEILKLNPASENWRERLETLRLYSQPISSPEARTVFGDGEVQKRARIIDSPAAIYPGEARAQKTKGDVRLRVVLAADGTVKNIFPIKSQPNGLTESAMEAARQIRFEPAIRNGQPASQFATFVYEFKKDSVKPYIPRTIF